MALSTACADNQDARADDSPPSLASGSADTRVAISDMAFSPDDVDVSVGDTVAWTFQDGHVPHNVTFEDGQSSKTQDTGSWSRSFDEAGTYEYHCTLHAQMRGTVKVS